jgi:YHS domain-containing protein
MKGRNKHFVTVMLLAGMLVIGLAVSNGCKKKSQTAAPTQPAETPSVAAVQTVCPIMGNPIDKNVYTVYKGKKVYFCCAACKQTFAKEPEKYLDKLPQFKN